MSRYLLEKTENVFVLTMNNGENNNTFNFETLAEFKALLDEIEASEGDASLLLTSSDEKTWCNGIDLDWLMQVNNVEESTRFVYKLEEVLLQMALLNLPTVACITGNCYAGGAILATGMDFRLMRSDRGRFCYSEINIKMPFTETMFNVVKQLPNKMTLEELTFTGKAMGGEECLPKQIVESIHPKETLYENAFARALELSTKHRTTYAALKNGLRSDLLAFRQHHQSLA